MLRVPLIVRAPGVSATRIGAVVRLTDVFASVLDLLHLPASPSDGQSLRSLMSGREHTADREAACSSRCTRSDLAGARSGRYGMDASS